MAARLRGMRGRQHVAMKPLSLAPFRVTNRALIQTHVENCQRIIGYRFRDPGLIREALTPFGSRNQRLAIAGDKVADLQLAARWYDSKGRLTPLQWELMKRALLSNTNLASVCFRLRIQDCTLSPCSTDRSMATTIEAIIGAVWLDSKRDLAAVASVMDRFGLTRHPLLPSPSPSTITANQPPCEIRSSRPLSNCFFIGHHLALLQLLFSHGQSFMVQQGTGRRSHLPWRAQRRDKGTERLPTGMWSRLKHISYAPQIMVRMAQKCFAARVGTRDKGHGQEPSPCQPTKLPEQHAPAPMLAINEQTNPGHRDTTLESTLPVQHPGIQSNSGSSFAGRHDESTGRNPTDTEWKRINWFIRSVENDVSMDSADQNDLIHRLRCHRQVLFRLPGKSRKNISSDFPTDKLCLTTHSADEASDRSLALQAEALLRLKRILLTNRGRMRGLQSKYKSHKELVLKQLEMVWRARLELWLPRDAPENEMPTSLPNLRQMLANESSDTPGSGSTVPAAVDSMGKPTTSSPEYKSPHRLGSVLWTTNAAQHMPVDWKQYLRKSTSGKA